MSDWPHLRKLIEQGLGVDPSERAAWLEKACEGDEALRGEAAELIEAATGDDAFLEPPAIAPGHVPVLGADAHVGAYRLLRPIASGGMGTVYEAERQDPHRRVALKVMRTGLAGAASAARFRYEVEVLAGLEHPHIARMYETGVHTDGSDSECELPWFAMEYVDNARPIVRYVHEEDLDLDARVRLVAAVCDAVHHGHLKGVLHRDLKPDNILVDAQGQPKVIDFGVARATDADHMSTRTRTGEVVGTMAYMSPEQIAGDATGVDVRGDVYALGVVLYEVLTGALPYDLSDANLYEAVRTIREAQPRRPSHVAPKVRGDLETITLKCLAKEPARRYASADALASDLRRLLAREPIEAHPPSLPYQLRMFARRHRALAVAIPLVVVVSIAAAIVSWNAMQDAREANRVSKELYGTLLKRSVETTSKIAPRLSNLSGGAKITEEMVEANLADLETLEVRSEGDPQVLHEIALSYLRLGEVQGDPLASNHLGDRAGSLASYKRAATIAERLYAAEPDARRVRHIRAMTLVKLGMFAAFDRDLEGAGEMLNEARQLSERLERENPDNPTYIDTLGLVEAQLATLAVSRKDQDAWRGHRERQRDLGLKYVGRWPARERAQQRAAQGHMGMAEVHFMTAAYGPARTEYAKAIGHLDSLIQAEPESVLYRLQKAFVLNHAAICHRKLGELDDAAKLGRAAVDLYVQLRDEDPDNGRIPLMLGMAHAQVGASARDRAKLQGLDTAERRRHLEAARDAYHEAWQIYAALAERGRLVKGHGNFADSMRATVDALEDELAED